MITYTLALFLSMLASANAEPDQPEDMPPRVLFSVPQLAKDLDKGSKADKNFAVREIKRQIRNLLRELRTKDELYTIEPMFQLKEFDALVAPVCIEDVKEHNEMTGHCADILRMLETKEALPALYTAAEQTGKLDKATMKRVQKAIDVIEATRQ